MKCIFDYVKKEERHDPELPRDVILYYCEQRITCLEDSNNFIAWGLLSEGEAVALRSSKFLHVKITFIIQRTRDVSPKAYKYFHDRVCVRFVCNGL